MMEPIKGGKSAFDALGSGMMASDTAHTISGVTYYDTVAEAEKALKERGDNELGIKQTSMGYVLYRPTPYEIQKQMERENRAAKKVKRGV